MGCLHLFFSFSFFLLSLWWLPLCQLIPKSFTSSSSTLLLPSLLASQFTCLTEVEFWTQPPLGQALDQFSLLTKTQACPPAAPDPQIHMHILPSLCGTIWGCSYPPCPVNGWQAIPPSNFRVGIPATQKSEAWSGLQNPTRSPLQGPSGFAEKRKLWGSSS